MLLAKLIAELQGAQIIGSGSIEVTDVCADSRAVKPGSLFFALPGGGADGASFAADAIKNGAVAVAAERNIENIPVLVLTPHVRLAFAEAAAILAGRPSEKLQLIGVTGTNGKTSVCSFLEKILADAGKEIGVIGTIEYRYGDKRIPAQFTTPFQDRWQSLLADMVCEKVESAVAEISSHALDQHRVAATKFSAAVFTNLSQDHLDYHGGMQSYFDAKKILFDQLLAKDAPAVINADDQYGEKLIEHLKRQGRKVLSYGENSAADVRVSNKNISLAGIEFDIATPVGDRQITAPLAGDFNVSNLAAAITVAIALGLDLGKIRESATNLQTVPGRLQRVESADIHCFIDYAHTPAAIENVLATLARLKGDGRLITVFGAGGDRDQTKRAPMGKAAAANSDLMILTSDNPRTENQDSIIEQVEVGLTESGAARKTVLEEKGDYIVEPDREKAIRKAIAIANASDTVAILGKGHEDYQILGRRKIYFSDYAQAKYALYLRTVGGRKYSFKDIRAGSRAVRVSGRRSVRFKQISTDTRSITPGDLYVALVGENHDGSRFVHDAVAKGAEGVMVNRDVNYGGPLPEETPLFETTDTLDAYGNLAAHWRQKFDIPVVAIAGSSGKTTVKDMAARMAASRYTTLMTKGNFNNLVGAPLTLLGLEKIHGAAIIEIGMNQPGEIARLTEITKPTIAVLLNVYPAHLEYCGGIEGVARAKAEMIDQINSSTLLIINADDERVVRIAARFEGKIVSFGKNEKADFRLLSTELDDRQRSVIRWSKRGVEATAIMPLAGEHNAYNFIAAAAIADAIGVGPDKAAEAVSDFSGSEMRGMIRRLRGDINLIDDSYNANPASLAASLKMLASLAGDAPKIAVLGDMLELGEKAPELHHQAGLAAVQSGVNDLIILGERAADYRAGAIGAGAAERNIHLANGHVEAAEIARRLASPGAWVLVKASRGSKLDLVVRELANGADKVKPV